MWMNRSCMWLIGSMQLQTHAFLICISIWSIIHSYMLHRHTHTYIHIVYINRHCIQYPIHSLNMFVFVLHKDRIGFWSPELGEAWLLGHFFRRAGTGLEWKWSEGWMERTSALGGPGSIFENGMTGELFWWIYHYTSVDILWVLVIVVVCCSHEIIQSIHKPFLGYDFIIALAFYQSPCSLVGFECILGCQSRTVTQL